MTKKKPSPSVRISIAKAVWRQSVLYSWVDEFGFCRCVTCGVRRAPNDPQMHCGHYIHGRNRIYFALMNAHPQCATCNGFKKGMPREYSLYIAEAYGVEALRWLHDQAKTRHDFPMAFIEQVTESSRIITRQAGGKPCR